MYYHIYALPHVKKGIKKILSDCYYDLIICTNNNIGSVVDMANIKRRRQR